jgi:tetratricopeptide (TPR) repeat protein
MGLWLGMGGVGALRAAETLPADRRQELARRGLEAFDEAVRLTRENPTRARELYAESAACFQSLVDAGVNNAALQYNLGNGFYRLEDLGRAILHYRRAERFDPRDENIQANLRYARQQVEPQFDTPQTGALSRTLLAWHYGTSPRTRFRIAAIGAIAGWTLLIARLRWRVPGLVGVGAALVLIGIVGAGSLAWQLLGDQKTPPAVVVAERQTLRLGRGDSYEPALSKPLGAGVELRIRQQRGDWVEVLLPDGKTGGWLPASAVERI